MAYFKSKNLVILQYKIFLVNDQRDAQISFYVFIFIFNSLHVSSTSCSSSGEINCVNTTSVSCHSVLLAVSCIYQESLNDARSTKYKIEIILFC
jgi:hypothetical protein